VLPPWKCRPDPAAPLCYAIGFNIPGFTDVRPVLFVMKCHTENSSQISHLWRLFFWQYSFSRHLRFMTTGEGRNNDRLKNWKLCVLWNLPFRHHGAIKLAQNCVCFTNPCINLFVPTFVTRKYHPKVLERLHLRQCISANLQKTLSWASFLVTRSRKPIKCVLKTLLRISTYAVPICPQKENGSPCCS